MHLYLCFASFGPIAYGTLSLTANQRTVSFPLRGQLTFLIIIITFVHREVH